MKFQFCLLTDEEARSGTKVGYSYANKIKDRWIQVSDTKLEAFLTVGYVKGSDFVRKNGKSYKIIKDYIDLDNDDIIIVATEVTGGCESIEF